MPSTSDFSATKGCIPGGSAPPPAADNRSEDAFMTLTNDFEKFSTRDDNVSSKAVGTKSATLPASARSRTNDASSVAATDISTASHTDQEVEQDDATSAEKKSKKDKKFTKKAFRLLRRLSDLHVSLSKPLRKKFAKLTKDDHRKRSRYNNGYLLPPDSRKSLAYLPNSVGLKNHGNTCFLNAVVQCLSHTDILAEYLVSDLYQGDLERHRKAFASTSTPTPSSTPSSSSTSANNNATTAPPAAAAVGATAGAAAQPNGATTAAAGGEMTAEVSKLLKSLWLHTYKPNISDELCKSVAKIGPQYRGWAQHDAQEFLLWILDHVHEELNTANRKHLKRLAADSSSTHGLACHMRSNSSFIYDVFQALYRSSLTCTVCQKQSNTFDPFLCVTLPIPQRSTRPVFLRLVPRRLDGGGAADSSRLLKIAVAIEASTNVKELREVIAQHHLHVSPNEVILTELSETGFHRTFPDDQSVNLLPYSENQLPPVYAIQLPSSRFDQPPATAITTTTSEDEELDSGQGLLNTNSATAASGGDRLEATGATAATASQSGAASNSSTSAKSQAPPEPSTPAQQPQLQYVNIIVICLEELDGSPAKPPLRFGVAPVSVRVSKEISFIHLQDEIIHQLRYAVKSQITTQRVSIMFRLRVIDGIDNSVYLNSQADHPLLVPAVDEALTLAESTACPSHLKLAAEWTTQNKKELLDMSLCKEIIVDDASVAKVKAEAAAPLSVSLDDCFNMHTSSEILTAEDAWFCPNCKSKSEKTVKKLTLWSLPDILVVHLKRFKQTATGRCKLSAHIDFPVRGLDMSKHVVHHQSSQPSFRYWSPWRRKRHQDSAAAAAASVCYSSRAGSTSASSHHHGSGGTSSSDQQQQDNMYDLYAVCNHYGSMSSGHYTAYCKNAVNGSWYCFDDSKVQCISDEKKIVSSEAYLLFYERRSLQHSRFARRPANVTSHTKPSENSKVLVDFAKTSFDHWIFRVPEARRTLFNIDDSKNNSSSSGLGGTNGGSGSSKDAKDSKDLNGFKRTATNASSNSPRAAAGSSSSSSQPSGTGVNGTSSSSSPLDFERNTLPYITLPRFLSKSYSSLAAAAQSHSLSAVSNSRSWHGSTIGIKHLLGTSTAGVDCIPPLHWTTNGAAASRQRRRGGSRKGGSSLDATSLLQIKSEAVVEESTNDTTNPGGGGAVSSTQHHQSSDLSHLDPPISFIDVDQQQQRTDVSSLLSTAPDADSSSSRSKQTGVSKHGLYSPGAAALPSNGCPSPPSDRVQHPLGLHVTPRGQSSGGGSALLQSNGERRGSPPVMNKCATTISHPVFYYSTTNNSSSSHVSSTSPNSGLLSASSSSRDHPQHQPIRLSTPVRSVSPIDAFTNRARSVANRGSISTSSGSGVGIRGSVAVAGDKLMELRSPSDDEALIARLSSSSNDSSECCGWTKQSEAAPTKICFLPSTSAATANGTGDCSKLQKTYENDISSSQCGGRGRDDYSKLPSTSISSLDSRNRPRRPYDTPTTNNLYASSSSVKSCNVNITYQPMAKKLTTTTKDIYSSSLSVGPAYGGSAAGGSRYYSAAGHAAAPASGGKCSDSDLSSVACSLVDKLAYESLTGIKPVDTLTEHKTNPSGLVSPRGKETSV